LLAACASAPPSPLPAALAAVDLRGTWEGRWGDTPLTLVVLEQADAAEGAGLYAGPVQILGWRRPQLTAVLTSSVAGHARSTEARGTLSAAGDRLAVWLVAPLPPGEQRLRLTLVDDDRLVGTGESSVPWGPTGDVTLHRR
ncbi:MAG TPA: hypothetical protein VLI67_07210, partial [Vicinamibacteria bacterium]|nr:hypothetical protein [Vicinamibacteria bacterium]